MGSINVTSHCSSGYYCPGGQSTPQPQDHLCPLGHFCPERSAAPQRCDSGDYVAQIYTIAYYIWQIVGQNQKISLHLDLRINPLSHGDYLPASISSIANLEAIELYWKIR